MRFIIITLLVFVISQLTAQEGYQMKGNEKYTEIDFLGSYYQQDGENGAVTGGKGTEELTDISSLIVVNMPLDSTKAIQLSLGADYYTSASTDNIDNNPSSASSKDVRVYANLGFNIKSLSKGTTSGVRLGFSSEYDYVSFNAGLNFAKEFNEGNSELSFSTQAFIDQWSLYFPSELRGDVSVPTKSRKSYNGQITFAQVVNKRFQFALSAEAIYMNGLLSTPFHRVYFNDVARPDIERLPESRLKIPLSIRATYFPFEKMVLRSYYRFYTDDFGIDAHTLSLDVPLKISDAFTVTPFYRYHTQTGSDYFAPYATHSSSDQYYTSDFDLSELSSNKVGLGISYSPLYGLARGKIPFVKQLLMLNTLSLRASSYARDTGLSAYAVSIDLNFRIQ